MVQLVCSLVAILHFIANCNGTCPACENGATCQFSTALSSYICSCTPGFEGTLCETSLIPRLESTLNTLQSQASQDISDIKDIADDAIDIMTDHYTQKYVKLNETLQSLVSMATTLVGLANTNVDTNDDVRDFIAGIIRLYRLLTEVVEYFGSIQGCTFYDTQTVVIGVLSDIAYSLFSNAAPGLLDILKTNAKQNHFLQNVQEITGLTKTVLEYINRTSCIISNSSLTCCVNQTTILLKITSEIGSGIVDVTEQIADICKPQTLDVMDIATEVFQLVVVEIDIMKITYCADENDTTSDCRMTREEARTVMDAIESTLQVMAKVAQDKGCSNKADPLLITEEYISVIVLQTKGENIRDEIVTAFTTLTMPFWETFQLTYKDTDIIIYILSYNDTTVSFALGASANDSAYMKTIVMDTNGNLLSLTDPEDTTNVKVSAENSFSGIWDRMDIINKTTGTFTCVGVPRPETTDMLIEVRFDSTRNCTTLGRYGTIRPENDVYDFLIETTGSGTILNQNVPKTMVYTFQSYTLTMSIKKIENGVDLEPLVLRVQCAGSQQNTQHEYRVAIMTLRVYNESTQTWTEGGSLKFFKSEASEIVFKSDFFGTLSANVFVIPPEIIDLSTFARFSELLNAPHGLATIIFLFVFFVALTIPLRRLDRRDRHMWRYLPLADNPTNAGFLYYISVYTDILSAKEMTATVYLEVKGKHGSSGIRRLTDKKRQNFGRGSCSNFLMKTKNDLGKLRELKVWHDGSGSSPRWRLNKIVILRSVSNVSAVFLCDQWLSLDSEDGKTWRRLKTVKSEVGAFNQSAKRRLFDDHLWLSLIKRPRFSRFTRVQRLWTLAALLFLTMLTSAMWYNTGNESVGRSIVLGPIQLNYKQFYVGMMSSAICVIPSLIIVAIFSNRKFRDTEQTFLSSKSVTAENFLLPWWSVFVAYFLILGFIGSSTICILAYFVQWGQSKAVDWLFSFFIGTVEDILVLQPLKVLLVAGVFTFLCKEVITADKSATAPADVTQELKVDEDNTVEFQSLEIIIDKISHFVGSSYLKLATLLGFNDEEVSNWKLEECKCDKEKTKTVLEKWLYRNMTVTRYLTGREFMELVRVMEKLDKKEATEWLFSHIRSEDDNIFTIKNQHNQQFPCPEDGEEGQDIVELRRRLQLDKKLYKYMIDFILRSIYITFLTVMCTHNTITTSFRQNDHLITSVNSSFQPNTTDDVYFWIERYFIPAVFPTHWEPGTLQIRSVYDQTFMHNAYGLRLGLARLRQIRVKEQCDIPDISRKFSNFCTTDYKDSTVDKGNYCLGWTEADENGTCFVHNTTTDYVQNGFRYSSEKETRSLPYFGMFAVYDGGGYKLDIGQKQSLALDYIELLKSNNWIDIYTRVLFVEILSFNANTQLFSHLKVVFEQPSFGGWYIKMEAWSSNLYPYTEARDFVIMAVQILFILILVVRIVLFCIDIVRLSSKCCVTLQMWITFLEILLSVGAIVSYGLRIFFTIDVIEEIFDEYGTEQFIPFENVNVCDKVYSIFLSIVLFIAILNLLKPLTFNYYLHVMRRSIAVSGGQIVTYIFMLSVALFSFSSLLYLLKGSTVSHFKDLPSSYVTLLNLVVSLFSVSKAMEIDDVQVRLIFGFFTCTMTLVLINMFISILNESFENVKNKKDKNAEFDEDLNKYLWEKIAKLFSLMRSKTDNVYVNDNNKIRIAGKKVVFLESLVSSMEKETRMYDTLVAINALRSYGTITLDSLEVERVPLRGSIEKRINDDCFIFQKDQDSLKIYLSMPHLTKRNEVTIKCAEIFPECGFEVLFSSFIDTSELRIFEFKKISEAKTTTKSGVLVQIFDLLNTHRQTSEIITASFDNLESVENYDAMKTAYGVTTFLRRIPTHIAIHNSSLKIDPPMSDIFEMFTVTEVWSCPRPSRLPGTSLKIGPGAVRGICKLYVKVQPCSPSTILQLISSEDIVKEIDIELPKTGQFQYEDKERQVIVLTREENFDWKSVKTDVVLDGNCFRFKVQSVKKCTKVSFYVKESEVRNPCLDMEFPRSIPDDTIRIIVDNVVREIDTECRKLLISLGISSLQIQMWHYKHEFEQSDDVTKDTLINWIKSKEDQISALKVLHEAVLSLNNHIFAEWLLKSCKKVEEDDNRKWNLLKRVCFSFNNDISWRYLAIKLRIYDLLLRNKEQATPRSPEESCFLVLMRWYRQNHNASVDDVKRFIAVTVFPLLEDSTTAKCSQNWTHAKK